MTAVVGLLPNISTPDPQHSYNHPVFYSKDLPVSSPGSNILMPVSDGSRPSRSVVVTPLVSSTNLPKIANTNFNPQILKNPSSIGRKRSKSSIDKLKTGFLRTIVAANSLNPVNVGGLFGDIATEAFIPGGGIVFRMLNTAAKKAQKSLSKRELEKLQHQNQPRTMPIASPSVEVLRDGNSSMKPEYIVPERLSNHNVPNQQAPQLSQAHVSSPQIPTVQSSNMQDHTKDQVARASTPSTSQHQVQPLIVSSPQIISDLTTQSPQAQSQPQPLPQEQPQPLPQEQSRQQPQFLPQEQSQPLLQPLPQEQPQPLPQEQSRQQPQFLPQEQSQPLLQPLPQEQSQPLLQPLPLEQPQPLLQRPQPLPQQSLG